MWRVCSLLDTPISDLYLQPTPLVDTLRTTTPLVNQVLLTWLANSFVYFRATDEERTTLGLRKPQGIGYGIGLAFAIFAMQGEEQLNSISNALTFNV